jgi:hypothetical protein
VPCPSKGSRRNPLIPAIRSDGAISTVAAETSKREFGRLKQLYGLAPLRVRDLTMLARLSLALARARAVPLVAA